MYKLDPPSLLFETSRPGRATAIFAPTDVPDRIARRDDPREVSGTGTGLPLPELGELDIVRHYTNLSALNMSIDSNFYPLGSCTMKYNPKRNERLAALPGLGGATPLSGRVDLARLLAILFELQDRPRRDRRAGRRQLATGRGGAGEMTALLVAEAYFRDQGGERRKRNAGAHPRQRPRHQPRLGAPRRVRDRHHQERQARARRPRRLPRQARRRYRRLHDDQPEHRRACSTHRSARSRPSCTTGGPCFTSTAPT